MVVIGTNQLVVSSIYFDLLYFYRRERERERERERHIDDIMIYSIMWIQCTYLLYLLSQLVTATKNPIGHTLIENDRSFFIFSLPGDIIFYLITWPKHGLLGPSSLLPIPVAVVVWIVFVGLQDHSIITFSLSSSTLARIWDWTENIV